MSRGRKPNPATELVNVETDHGALRKDQDAMDALVVMDQKADANTQELAKFLGYDGPLQAELLEHGIAQQMRRTVDACLEMGKMLLLLKERVGHGEFIERLEHLGLAARAAQKFMQSAYKFANAPLTAHLKRAIGSQTKLIELLVLDDEEIEELNEAGSTLGITVDEIGAMSASELRAALREAREDVAAKDRLLEEKNKKLDKVLASRKFKPSEDSIAQTAEQQAQLDELHEVTGRCEVTFIALANVVESVMASDSKAVRGRGAQAVQYLVQRLVDVIDEHGIEIDLSNPVDMRPEDLGSLPGKGTRLN